MVSAQYRSNPKKWVLMMRRRFRTCLGVVLEAMNTLIRRIENFMKGKLGIRSDVAVFFLESGRDFPFLEQ